MTYQITLTNGTPLTTISDATLDNTTSLTLLGKNYPGYGTAVANDLVHLLENAANVFPPAVPLIGQLWYDTSVAIMPLMKVWTGKIWSSVNQVSSVLSYSGAVTLAQMIAGGLAPLASPALTGVPTAPTANAGTGTNQLASTAFVLNQINTLVTGVSSVCTYTGVVTLPQLLLAGLAPIVSPNLSGLPTAPTAPTATATTQIASTAFVKNAINNYSISTEIIGVLTEWDGSVAVGQACYYDTTSNTYKQASGSNDLQAPIGVRALNNVLITSGNSYVAPTAMFTKGLHYYVDPANPGKLITTVGDAHVGYASEIDTLQLYDLPLPNLHIATKAKIYAASTDAILTLSRADQALDSKHWEWRATAGPIFALSLRNDAGTVLTDVMQFTRTGTTVNDMVVRSPFLHLYNGSLCIGLDASSQSILNFTNNIGVIGGYLKHDTSSNITLCPTVNGSGAMTLNALGNLSVASLTSSTLSVAALASLTSLTVASTAVMNGMMTANAPVTTNALITANAGVVSSAFDANGAHFRAIYGGYGAMVRNDGANCYLLSTAAGAPSGIYNGFRPFSWDLASGAVTIDGTAVGTTIGGVLTASNGFVQQDGTSGSTIPGFILQKTGVYSSYVTVTNSAGVVYANLFLKNARGYIGFFVPPGFPTAFVNSEIGGIVIDATKANVAYQNNSDYRLKENVTPLVGATARVNQLQPKRFNFIGSDLSVDGFLAHELQEHLPVAVSGSKDELHADDHPDGYYKKDDPKFQGADNSKLVPLLVAAIQEANQMIGELSERLTALEQTRAVKPRPVKT